MWALWFGSADCVLTTGQIISFQKQPGSKTQAWVSSSQGLLRSVHSRIAAGVSVTDLAAAAELPCCQAGLLWAQLLKEQKALRQENEPICVLNLYTTTALLQRHPINTGALHKYTFPLCFLLLVLAILLTYLNGAPDCNNICSFSAKGLLTWASPSTHLLALSWCRVRNDYRPTGLPRVKLLNKAQEGFRRRQKVEPKRGPNSSVWALWDGILHTLYKASCCVLAPESLYPSLLRNHCFVCLLSTHELFWKVSESIKKTKHSC